MRADFTFKQVKEPHESRVLLGGDWISRPLDDRAVPFHHVLNRIDTGSQVESLSNTRRKCGLASDRHFAPKSRRRQRARISDSVCHAVISSPISRVPALILMQMHY